VRKFFKTPLVFLRSLFAVGSAKAELTQAQLSDMMNQQRYVFHVNRPTSSPREVEVIFDLD